jgi:hypothetical protein
MQNDESRKPSRVRRYGIVATAGVALAGAAFAFTTMTSAHAADGFAAVFTPTAEDPAVAGNGMSFDYNTAQSLALNGLSDLCKNAGYVDVGPGVQTNAAAAQAGQSKAPTGEIVFQAFGTCTR